MMINDQLKTIIKAEVDGRLKDIRYKLSQNVPREFITPIQQEIFVFEWVLDQIKKLENDSQQNT